ncbi:hypothetical protein VEE32_26630 [Escherichia coli]|nr:hypothetical protein VEE32_26630 [Escherichia coli]
MDHLPIFCQLRDRDCLIVGGGDVAERKARLLLDAGARLTVNALAFIPQFTAWADAGMLTLVEGPFDESLLDTCWLAIAATDDDALNQRVSEAAEARRIFCNVVDAPKAASFIMPSIIDRSPLMVAVSSGGTSPVLARLLREKLESLLPLHLGQVAKYAGQLRGRVKQQFATMGERRRFWEKLFVNDRLAQSLANNDQKAITETTEQLINEPLDHRGEVVLVGAGPGDAGLLTLKGLQQIQQADVVVYDRLVSDDIMNLVRRDADRVFVGKRAGYHCVPQEEINQILLREAQKRQTRGAAERWRSVYFWPWWRRAGNTVQRGYSVLGGSGYYRSFWLLCLFGYSTHASRLCPERTLNYRTLKNRWRAGLGKPGGRKTDAGVLYGVESGRDYSAKAD